MDALIDWLMEGDPAIRWQTLRDLLAAPEAEWRAEQQRTLSEGWGAQLLAQQDADGTWGGGLYSPKWISTTYTLLNLINIGIPPECAAARLGARRVLDGMLGPQCDDAFRQKLADMDRCIVGMLLRIAVYFEGEDELAERIGAMVDNLLDERMPDGAWNCRRHSRPRPHHSSFHTTFNVLDGLRETIEHSNTPRRAELPAVEQRALEFMLEHRLYLSDHTGQEINPKFTLLSYPHHWHYNTLRGLEYFARAQQPRDPRLQDAIDLLAARRRADGRWPVQHKFTGRVFFEMEKTGGPSRWNSLRALRVLNWWQARD